MKLFQLFTVLELTRKISFDLIKPISSIISKEFSEIWTALYASAELVLKESHFRVITLRNWQQHTRVITI